MSARISVSPPVSSAPVESAIFGVPLAGFALADERAGDEHHGLRALFRGLGAELQHGLANLVTRPRARAIGGPK